MIAAGQKLPSVTIKQATAEGANDIDPSVLFAGKTGIIFALPGAFTPTCSQKHLPGFVAEYDALRAKGVEVVACLSVNDASVMKAWGEAHDALAKIVMLADGNAAFSKALGIDADFAKFGMGVRARRGVIHLTKGVVSSVDFEEPGKFEVSSAEACLLRLK
jgi:peroxiredoxin